MDWGTSEKTLFGVFIKFGDLDRVVLVKGVGWEQAIIYDSTSAV